MCEPSCGYQHEFTSDCGQYEVWQLATGDCWVAYYYEKSSGMLAALFSECAANPIVCQFGPGGFTQPLTCSPWVELHPCGDAGSDASSGD